MNEKIYVGKGKAVGQYGNISFSVDLDALTPHAFEYNGKRYVKLIMSQMRQADQYGKTHTVQIDTWKPDQDAAKSETPARAAASQPAVPYPTDDGVDTRDIPF